MGINNTELGLETAWYCHTLRLQRTWVQRPLRDSQLPAMSVPEGSFGLYGHTHVVHTHKDAHKYVRLNINPELRCLWKRREYERNIRAPGVLTPFHFQTLISEYIDMVLFFFTVFQYMFLVSYADLSILCFSLKIPLVFRAGELWQVSVSSRSLTLHHMKIPTGSLFSRQRKWKFDSVPMKHKYLEVTCFI